MSASEEPNPGNPSPSPLPQVTATSGGMVVTTANDTNLRTGGIGDQIIQHGMVNAVGVNNLTINLTSDHKVGGVLADYLRSVVDVCNVVWCPGLETDEANRIGLLAVYAELHTREPSEVDESKDVTFGHVPSRSKKRVSAIRSVVQHQRLAILGEPGGGKSTFLRYLAVSLAWYQLTGEPETRTRLTSQGWPEDWLDAVPIWVELRKLPKPETEIDGGQRADWLWDAIVEQIQASARSKLPEVGRLLEGVLEEGRAVVLLDGLDEVTDHARKEIFQDAIWDFVNKRFQLGDQPVMGRRNRFVLTCRKRTWDTDWAIASWRPENGAEIRVIDWLGQQDRSAFLERWFREQARILKRREAEGAVGKPNEQLAKTLEALPKELEGQLEDSKRNRNRRLESLIALPLNLTMIAWLRSGPDAAKRPLPQSRAAIFEQTIHAILWDLDDRKGLKKAEDLTLPQLVGSSADRRRKFEGVLAKIAFDSLKENPLDPLPGISHTVLKQELRAFCGRGFGKDPDVWRAEVLKTIQCRAGLLKEAANRDGYEFAHRTFQEFLAGVHMATRPDFSLEATAWLEAEVEQPADLESEAQLLNRERLWEPLLLACGYLAIPSDALESRYLVSNQRSASSVRELVGQLVQGIGKTNWRNVWLGGELLLEVELGVESTGTWKRLLEVTSRQLLTLVETGELSPAERAAAGRCLGWVGDPRRGVVPRNLPGAPQRLDLGDMAEMEFCYVPADPPRKGKKSSKTSDEVGVGYDFWIGRFPVTVAQFRCFAEDGGYANKDWWTEAIDVSCWQAGKLKVYDWSEEDKKYVTQVITGPARLEPRFDVPNHPVVSVNWFEATAFAQWLDAWLHSQSLLPGGLVLRLASEHEWQRAAQGGRMIPQEGKWIRHRLREGLTAKGDSINGWCENIFPGRTFPWEGDEIHDRANWRATGINGTSVVGGFPEGRSPVGAEEMAGNVWEWTDSWYDDAKTLRVLRGGSRFGGDSGILRCAYRDGINPGFRDDCGGFRCVVVARAAAGR